jgi:hypothetical protein
LLSQPLSTLSHNLSFVAIFRDLLYCSALLFLVDQNQQELWTALMLANQEVRFPTGLGIVGWAATMAQPILVKHAQVKTKAR